MTTRRNDAIVGVPTRVDTKKLNYPKRFEICLDTEKDSPSFTVEFRANLPENIFGQ